MDAQQIKATLKEAMASILDQALKGAEREKVMQALSKDDDAWLGLSGWDSMDQVNILLILEEECSIRYTEEEFATLETAADILALTQRKVNEDPAEAGAEEEDDGFGYF